MTVEFFDKHVGLERLVRFPLRFSRLKIFGTSVGNRESNNNILYEIILKVQDYNSDMRGLISIKFHYVESNSSRDPYYKLRSVDKIPKEESFWGGQHQH